MYKTKIVKATYKNWCGDVAERRFIPLSLKFGANQWHKEEQWLLIAWDVDKQAERTFAVKDFNNWQEDDTPIG